jgi:hypothetical protein
MADQNTLNNLIPDLYAAIDRVRRELTGFIPAVSRDSRAERAGKGDSVRVPVTTGETAKDITPSNVPPDSGGTEVNTRKITISKSRAVEIQFTGEEIQSLQNSDTTGAENNYEEIRQNRIVQAMRTLVNEVETDLASLCVGAAQAYGTPSVTPFGTKDDFTDFAGVEEILDDHGAPSMDRQLVAGSQAWKNLRGVQTGILQRANEAGTDAALRNGEFGEVHDMTLRNSAQVQSHSHGTLTDVTANANEVGTTQVDVETAGSSGDISLNGGDVISFAGDDNLYVVAEDTSAGSGVASTTIPIREPGLRVATADGDSVSAESDYTANAAFHQSAIQLATRAPALPNGGDMAADRTQVTDPQTGLTFDVAQYDGYHQRHWEIGLAWGQAVTKEEFLALLLG